MDLKESILKPLRLLKNLTKEPVTVDFKDIYDNPRETYDGFRGFHTNDWDKCIGCGTCSEICPTEAIIMADRAELDEEIGKKASRPTIDYGRCCFCGLCVDICTTESLKLSKEYLYNTPNPDEFYFMPEEKFLGKEVKEGYVKTEASNLLALEKTDMNHASPDERKDSFMEYVKGFSKDQAIKEAARCVECGICTTACPATMNIPEYINAIWNDNFEDALTQVYKTNPLPGVCGRVCTHKCESVCAIGHLGDPVAIRWLKRYITDNTPNEIYESVVLEPVSESGKGNIAIVGGGPAGLSAAYYLRTLGYDVTIYEALNHVGGVMRYGIPKYRLPDSALDKDVSFIEKIGVSIKTNVKIGTDITLEELNKNNDAVFLSTGYMGARKIPVPGSDHENVLGAMDFLPGARDYGRGEVDIPDVHESVVVIGGGDVSFDCSRTSTRVQIEKYGKANVYQVALEEYDCLPASLEEKVEGSEEGLKTYFGYGPQEIVVEEGKIKGLKIKKVISIFDEDCKFNPSFDDSTEELLPATQIIMAVGQEPNYDYLSKFEDKVNINQGKIEIDENNRVVGLENVFAGGDITKGPDIITGINDGHQAAISIDKYLLAKK